MRRQSFPVSLHPGCPSAQEDGIRNASEKHPAPRLRRGVGRDEDRTAAVPSGQFEREYPFPPGQDAAEGLDAEVLQRLERIEAALRLLVRERTIKNWYTTTEVASLIGRAEFTVREWCRLRRIHAEKRACGRGLSHEWIISHAELTRFRNEGLLPLTKHA